MRDLAFSIKQLTEIYNHIHTKPPSDSQITRILGILKRFNIKGSNLDWGKAVREGQELFLQTENLIESDILFWKIFGTVWTLYGSADKRWEDAWNRKTRLKIHINQRISFSNNGDTDYEKDYFQKRNSATPIKVYRYFYVKKGHSIRKGDTKNHSDWKTQQEGAGLAYSLSAITAMQMSYSSFNKEVMRRRVPSLSEDEITKIQKLKKSLGQYEVWQGNDCAMLGTYTIYKPDIITTLLKIRQEEEVIAKKATLERYEVITGEMGLAAEALFRYRMIDSTHDSYVFLNGKGETKMLNLFKNFIHKLIKKGELDWNKIYSNPTLPSKINEWINVNTEIKRVSKNDRVLSLKEISK